MRAMQVGRADLDQVACPVRAPEIARAALPAASRGRRRPACRRAGRGSAPRARWARAYGRAASRSRNVRLVHPKASAAAFSQRSVPSAPSGKGARCAVRRAPRARAPYRPGTAAPAERGSAARPAADRSARRGGKKRNSVDAHGLEQPPQLVFHHIGQRADDQQVRRRVRRPGGSSAPARRGRHPRLG